MVERQIRVSTRANCDCVMYAKHTRLPPSNLVWGVLLGASWTPMIETCIPNIRRRCSFACLLPSISHHLPTLSKQSDFQPTNLLRLLMLMP
jgi:hypothetical protein